MEVLSGRLFDCVLTVKNFSSLMQFPLKKVIMVFVAFSPLDISRVK
ncbi:hypothetical protein B4096_1182 [Heyndrickxia coagulans]|nr:hypothetical protein B4096_1182 [Heyndrickxia coagulans]